MAAACIKTCLNRGSGKRCGRELAGKESRATQRGKHF
jgi:hypothetical protein